MDAVGLFLAAATLYFVVLAVNTVLTVVLQVYVARLARGVPRAVPLLRLAAVPLFLSCLLFASADGRGGRCQVEWWPSQAA